MRTQALLSEEVWKNGRPDVHSQISWFLDPSRLDGFIQSRHGFDDGHSFFLGQRREKRFEPRATGNVYGLCKSKTRFGQPQTPSSSIVRARRSNHVTAMIEAHTQACSAAFVEPKVARDLGLHGRVTPFVPPEEQHERVCLGYRNWLATRSLAFRKEAKTSYESLHLLPQQLSLVHARRSFTTR